VPASGPSPLDVAFNNQSIGEELTFSWNFGDNSPASTDRDPQHRYETAGEYQVTLNVTNPSGSDQASATITVIEPDAPPVAAFTAFPETGPAPLSVQFSNGTAGDDLTYNWNFGDNSPASTVRDPQHTFASEGSYTIVLTVTGPGGSDSEEFILNVGAPVAAPDASFVADPNSGEALLTVNFDSTGDPANITAYSWDFGDDR
jgi:PKD repeat protein